MPPAPTPPTLRVGTALWAHRAWVGAQYPSGTRSGEELAEYVTWCTAVEGNTTFYALPGADTVHRWAAVAPASFRFLFKVPRRITHEQRLRGTEADLLAFVRLLEPLGERLGPFSIQLPPSFAPADLRVLAAFLRRLPTHVRWAVEVRHPDFFTERSEGALLRLLEDTGTERVSMDTTALFAEPPKDDAERDTWAQKPRVPARRGALTETPVVRYIGRTDPTATIAGWQPWLPVVTGWLSEGRSPVVFIHTPDNVDALWLVRRFHEEVRALALERGLVLAPLPVPNAANPSPVQERLFDWGAA